MEVIKDDYISKLEAVRILQKAYAGGRIQAKDGCVSLLDDINALPSADVQEKKYCKMIPLEPDCRGYTDVFICTNCHQHIHLGFIRQEYSGSFCLECGAEVMDGDANE